MTAIAEAAAPILSCVPPRRDAAETGGLDLAVVAASDLIGSGVASAVASGQGTFTRFAQDTAEASWSSLGIAKGHGRKRPVGTQPLRQAR